MGKVNLNVRFDEVEKARLEHEAAERGLSLSDMIREKISTTPRMHPYLEQWVKGISSSTDIPPHLVIENTLIGVIADRDAVQHVYGEHAVPLDEFIVTDKGVITGDELYRMLYEQKVRDLENQRERELLDAESAGSSLDSDETCGSCLRALMVDHPK